MLKRQFVLLSGLLAGVLVGVPSRSVEAGPLLDWLFHKPAYGPAIPVGTPYPVAAGYAPYAAGYAGTTMPVATLPATTLPSTALPYSTGYTPYGVALPGSAYRYSTGYTPSYNMPTYGTYYGANAPVVGAGGYGYLAQRPANETINTAPAVIPPGSPVTLVPDYRSTASRVPVTYYRPVLTTDPNTGSQVVTLAPCSSYEYQTQRVPTWGLTQVYNGGATLPATMPVAPPVASPTYSLPRGGVPLAGPVVPTQPYTTAYGTYPVVNGPTVPGPAVTGSIMTPASPGTLPATQYSSGYPSYASNYSNYSSMQPPPYVPPPSNYSTVPYNGTTSYYGSGSTGGGSTGTYAPPTSSVPYGTSPAGTYSSPGLPPLTTSPAAPGVYPPSTGAPFNAPGTVLPPGAASTDPAAGSIPSLPPAFNSGARLESKPQLQNIVQQPIGNTRSLTPSSTPAPAGDSQKKTSNEGLLPVPVPEDFDHEPRWNPGLLKENDATATNMRAPAAQTAWGSKPIRWASLKSSKVLQPKSEMSVPLPPAEMRSIPRAAPAEVQIEIPEVPFAPVQPSRLQQTPAEQPAVQPPAPERTQQPVRQPQERTATNSQSLNSGVSSYQGKPLRTDVWQAVK